MTKNFTMIVSERKVMDKLEEIEQEELDNVSGGSIFCGGSGVKLKGQMKDIKKEDKQDLYNKKIR